MFVRQSERRECFLERQEAARLLAAALGYRPAAFEVNTREPILLRRLARPHKHVARGTGIKPATFA